MLSEAGRDCVEAAIRAAERGTAGEIVVVLARQAASYKSVPLLYGVLAALAVPPVLIGGTGLSAIRIFAIQLAVALAAVGLGLLGGSRLVPAQLRRARARAAAAREFRSRGMADTRGRTGVLLYVALAERYAEVIGDRTVAGRVDPAAWRDIIEALIAAMREGRTADALVAAVERIGTVLAQHVPPGSDDTDELPNRIVLL